MKKISTLLAAVIIAGGSFAQSQRLTLLEEFTQASCGPCASQNPALNALLGNNPTKVVSIKYQTSWPGVDPMNAQNPSEVQTRVSYYNVTGVPNIRYDGNVTTGAPSALTQTIINNEYAVTSPFTLSVNHTISAGFDSAFITVVVTCTQATSGTLKLHLAMTEDTILFTTAPGTNGETDFFGVMRKMIPNASGTTLATSWTVNQTQTFNFAVPIPGYIYNKNAVGFVAFIQDDANKNVKQAGYSSPVNLTPSYNNEAAVTAITYPGTLFCGSTIAPKATIQNNGSSNLTSLVLTYTVNGGAPTVFNWTGNLGFLGTATVTLPSSSFTNIFTANQVVVTASMPNGNNDQLNYNNARTHSFDTKQPAANINLTIKPDAYGSEITWTLKNSANQTIYSGGPYTNNNTNLITVPWTIPANDCYEFTINDSYGDGILSPGYYRIRDVNNLLVFQGGGTYTNYTTVEKTPFQGTAASSIVENELSNAVVNIFPNPTSGQTNIAIDLFDGAETSIVIYSIIGEKVYNEQFGALAPGTHNITFDGSALSSGVYFVNITVGNETISKKITINK